MLGYPEYNKMKPFETYLVEEKQSRAGHLYFV